MSVSSEITGIGVYIPKRKISNDDVLEMMKQKSEPYLKKEELDEILTVASERLAKAGNVTRYWCDDDEYCTDIAYRASLAALEDAGLEAGDLDLIIFTGMSKAFVEPATAHVLRHKLQALRANVIDTQDACTSFIKSMEIGHALIRSGHYSRVLVVAGERTFDWADMVCKTRDELAWKFGSLTIGDGAGAVILEATDNMMYAVDGGHMRFSYELSDGQYHLCTIGLNYKLGERYKLYTHTPDLFKSAYVVTRDCVKNYFHGTNGTGVVYDNLFFHDVGKLAQDSILSFLADSSITVRNPASSFYPEYGNVASVSLPLSMWRARGNGYFKKGNLALCIIPASGTQCGIVSLRY
jgi:3-oxoacyl-[acyl-carrier-protein] synthase-3